MFRDCPNRGRGDGGFRRGGVLASAFGNMQVVAVFDGHGNSGADGGQIDGSAAVRLVAVSSWKVTSRMVMCLHRPVTADEPGQVLSGGVGAGQAGDELTVRPRDYLWVLELGPAERSGSDASRRKVTKLESSTAVPAPIPQQSPLHATQRGHHGGPRGAGQNRPVVLDRADYPADAFGHQHQILAGAQGHSTDGFCRECPAESISKAHGRK